MTNHRAIRARAASARCGDALPIEIVERKGTGHPDTICDALAEALSRALSRAYRETCGLVLHHNVDKVLLVGGAAAPRYGGGEILKPVEIYMAGRATDASGDLRVPVETLAVDGSRRWLREHLHALDTDGAVRIHNRIKPGSLELVELYRREARTGVRHSNDTSCGVGFAPFSSLESIVYSVERALNAPSFKAAHPATGEDVKVMGVRRGTRIHLTISCAIIDRHVRDLDDYRSATAAVAIAARTAAARIAEREVDVVVNAADDLAAGSVYLTVTGTSAESGDDGEAGRGNRANGLITPCRTMTMESVAGKNAITHVGKLYNVAASLIAADIVELVPEVVAAECRLVSRIGRSIAEPEAADIVLTSRAGVPGRVLRAAADRIAQQRLQTLAELGDALIDGDVAIDRWPLGHPRREVQWRADRSCMLQDIATDARLTAAQTGREQFAQCVMTALGRVPRHEFVPVADRDAAYVNAPLPIGCGQTISQPFIVALMTDLLDLDPGSRILEIGTGSGYQCAVLAELAARVHSIEVVAELASEAAVTLARLGYRNVRLRVGDGYLGWPDAAPFDAIIVTSGAADVPPPLIEQLAPGGRLVIPVGRTRGTQSLLVIEKRQDGSVHQRDVLPVAFVPFTRAS
jgi:S-adenosylmethionine synthetase